MRPRASQVTATEQVGTALRKMLAFGELGHPLPPERQLAMLFGVSRVTVRRALSQLEQEGQIRREQGRGTYFSRGPAIIAPREAIRSRQPVIALLTEQSGTTFNPQLTPWTWRVALSIQAALEGSSVELCIVNSDRFLSAIGQDESPSDDFLGFIAPTHLWTPEKYEAACALGVPFVGLGRTSLGMYWNIVDLQWEPGLGLAMKELRPTPEDRVFIPGDPHPREIDRQLWLQLILGYLDRYGVPADQIVIRRGGMFEQQGYLAMRWYLREYGLPTLVLSDFDLSVAGAYRALYAYATPVDEGSSGDAIRFLGSTGMEISEHLDPPLSTLSCDFGEVTDVVIAMLRQQHETGRPRGLHYIQARYMGRASSKPRAGRKKPGTSRE
jgi:DNA-binding LacI/PurR family transcriptional regulator